jgi:hypothetical protein
MLTGSREALLLCLFFYLFIEFKKINNVVAILRFSIRFISIFGLIIIFLLYFTLGNIDDIAIIAKLVTILESSDINSITAGRHDVLFEVVEAFDMGGLFFLFGSGFRTDIGELGTPHNQYVEWFLRGGVVFALANISMLCWSIYRHFLIGGPIHHAAGIVLISALLISNNINTPFRVPYTSVFFWFLIGLSFVPKHSFLGAGRSSKDVFT